MLPLQEASHSFKKLVKMLPDNTEVMFQLAQCYDLLNDFQAVSAL